MKILLKEDRKIIFENDVDTTNWHPRMIVAEFVLVSKKSYKLFIDDNLEAVYSPVGNQLHLAIFSQSIEYYRKENDNNR